MAASAQYLRHLGCAWTVLVACACGPAGGPDGGPGDGGPSRPADAGSVDSGSWDDGGQDGGGVLDGGPPDGGMDGGVDLGPSCHACHGSAASPAPPIDLSGNVLTALRTVGAHQAHLAPGAPWHRDVRCEDCHRVPAGLLDPGHLDEAPADVTFGPVANAGGVTSTWTGATCDTWCHGATQAGGSVPAPRWTLVDGSQAGCGACHGLPPPAPHPAALLGTCDRCHPGADGFSFRDPGRHIDGQVDLNDLGCAVCHGSDAGPAPPRDLAGNTSTSLRTVGAHQAHLASGSSWHRPVACADCHLVPRGVRDVGHLDGPPADLSFSPVANAGGVASAWNGATCATWCHGAALRGGAVAVPTWTRVDGSQAACGACHGLPPPAPHPPATLETCGLCHPNSAGPVFLDPSRHIDGKVDLSSTACNACHGSTSSAAPPRDVAGHTATTARGVGAHQAHLGAGSGWHRDGACNDCHLVPADFRDPGHLDTSPGAELTWGPVATARGQPASWSGTTCTTACHGAALGSALPVWTQVGTGQAACGTCHGLPPAAPHPAATAPCSACHPDAAPDGGFLVPQAHVDGVVDVLTGCTACHGSGPSAAPPRDLAGNVATFARGVGAHRQHLVEDAGWHLDVRCGDCHLVPAIPASPGHYDGTPGAEVTWSALASGGGVPPAWNGSTCTTYCHGDSLGGLPPTWTQVDGGAAACGTCHGLPPPAPHPATTAPCSNCHPSAAPDGGFAFPQRHIDGVLDLLSGCSACHGSSANAAPPLDTAGFSATSLRTVGAHQAHLAGGSGWHRDVACADCHQVPSSILDLGHLDAPPAEVRFSPLSATRGVTPAWTGATCTTWCHGAALDGGSVRAPAWTRVDGTQAGCGSCHGLPPPPPHPASTLNGCELCHSNSRGLAFLDPGKHIDGTVDVTSQACNACHGSAANAAPPRDTTNGTATTTRGVGAHQAHLLTGAAWHRDVTCSDCHLVPATVDSPGHVNDATPGRAEVTWSVLSSAGGVTPAWAGTTCTTYCHGASMTGPAPTWTRVGEGQAGCGTCHGLPPPAPHPASTLPCSSCHPDALPDGGFSAPQRHVDGVVDLLTACNACHGSTANAAPPRDTRGATATTAAGVGAHQAHLGTGSSWHRDTGCADCHRVPASVTSPGHLDGTPTAELTWSPLSSTAGVQPAYLGGTCTTYCHGASMAGAAPAWTRVGAGQAACGTCHGLPPPAPHPATTAACSVCHPDAAPDGGFLTPARHIDGVVDVFTACNACHGSAVNAAPPRDAHANTATGARGVGAHQSHLAVNSAWHKDVACTDCHLVPAALSSPGHLDATPLAEVTWSAISRAGGVSPAWGGTTCTTYCHGASLAGRAPTWTSVGTGEAACGRCHGLPPPAPHPAAGPACSACHPDAAPDGGFSAPQRHIDGVVDVLTACDACHGSAASPAPPRDTLGNAATTARGVGAHQAHLGAGSSWHRDIPCTDCHLVPAAVGTPGHVDTTPHAEVVWGPVSAAFGVTPAWTGATCTTACHGAASGAPAPTWTSVGTGQAACGRCHGLPPPAPHPASAAPCSSCHPDAAPDGGFLAPQRHVDGVVDVFTACNACHGSAASDAPPRDVAGNTGATARGVGAHQAHLRAGSSWHRDGACTDCHQVPAAWNSPGHLDGTPLAEVTWSPLSATNAVTPAWNGTSCTTYCHGASMAGPAPGWASGVAGQAACGTCHGLPPPAPHPPAGPACSSCHAIMAPDGGFRQPQRHIDGVLDVNTACDACHGSGGEAAPPQDVRGNTATSARGVGTHRAHLQAATAWHRTVLCQDCHLVPTVLNQPGHLDTALPAELSFSAVASAGGVAGRFDGVTCTTWCHGATLGGRAVPAPVWTAADGGQAACGACHGLPPPAPHPSIGATPCGVCHPDALGLAFSDPARHVDGVVDLNQACNACHGSSASPAPPRDLSGNTATTARGVGAHQPHLATGSSWHRDLPCTDCHLVPTHLEDPGHLDAPPAELTWGPVARAGGVFPSWDGGSCGTYCHGASMGMPQPSWTAVGTGQAACGRCHGLPPPPPHPANAACERCHPNAGPGNTFTAPQQHVDGVVQLSTACNGCHGSAANPAPPTSTTGATLTADRTVGAHQAHLSAASWHAPVPCAECHVVPTTWSDPGHIGASPAEVTFGPLARTGGAAPTWNGTSCANTYCHGATLPAGNGSNVAPTWTTVNGTQDACGTCHGLPPGGTHPQTTASCGTCHAAVIGLDGGFVDASLHLDGLVEATAPCGSCHGLPPPTGTHLTHAGLAAPIYGGLGTAAALPAPVGYAFGCGTCHPLDGARHQNGGRAEVELANVNAPAGSLKALSPLATYSPGATVYTDAFGLPYTQGTCANVYCHSGPSYAAAAVPTPAVDFTFTGYPITYPAYPVTAGRSYASVQWGAASPGCGGCHGFPIRPSAAADAAMAGQSHSWLTPAGEEAGHGWNHGFAPISCRTCHAQTVTQANATSRAAGLSVYGAVPITGYAQHVDGHPDVVFSSGEVLPYPRLKAMGAPTYNVATRTCSSVACHLAQTQVRSGAPYREGVELECDVCHQL